MKKSVYFNSFEFAEKSAFRQKCLAAGLATLCIFGVMVFWSEVYFPLLGVFGVTSTAARDFYNNPTGSHAVQIAVSFFMMVPAFAVVAAIFGIGGKIPYAAPKKQGLFAAILLGVGFCFLADYLSNITNSMFDVFGFEESASVLDKMPSTPFGILIAAVSVSVMPALVEEFAMRGVILTLFKPFGNAIAILCSATLFGFMHARFSQFIFAFLVGLVLGFLTVKFNSVWPAVIVHFLNNFISFSEQFVYNFFTKYSVLFNSVMFAAIIGVLFISVLLISKKHNNFFNIESNNNGAATGKKAVWFFTHPAIIAVIIGSVYIAAFKR